MVKHRKTKVRHVTKQVKPKDYDELKKNVSEYKNKEKWDTKINAEIKELEEKKKLAPKGFRGGLAKMNMTRQINERKSMLTADRRAELMDRRAKQLGSALEYEKKKSELGELRKKNQVSFEGLGGFDTQKKQLKFEDLF